MSVAQRPLPGKLPDVLGQTGERSAGAVSCPYEMIRSTMPYFRASSDVMK